VVRAQWCAAWAKGIGKMDIILDKISVESLKIAEGSTNEPVASGSPRAEEDRGKTSESEISGHVDNQQLRELTEKLQGYVDKMNINVAFSTYGGKNKKIAITVSEKETGKLIREIPPEEMQQLYVKMEQFVGMLFSEMV